MSFSVAARKRRSRRGRHTALLENHYRVDPKDHLVLPGLPKYDNDFNRDAHDFFNLIVLVPVVILNMLNWNWDVLLDFSSKGRSLKLIDAWTEEWFDLFWWVTLSYFVVDMVWVAWIPSCVRSPGTIIKHHIATLIYIMVPYKYSAARPFMGACMSVEINTWFLIARRIFNKQGFSPWVVQLPGTVSPSYSIRIKFISIFFYVTWISIRCVLYPFLLWYFAIMSMKSVRSVYTAVLPIHFIFCVLNLRWTYDLCMSKILYWKRLHASRKRGGKMVADMVDKGL
jgi:hypothetical protein